jgi:hypothetical protein
LYVLLLDGDALGVNGTQICIVEEIDKERFCGLLQRLDSLTLPSGRTLIGGHHLRNLANLVKSALVMGNVLKDVQVAGTES